MRSLPLWILVVACKKDEPATSAPPSPPAKPVVAPSDAATPSAPGDAAPAGPLVDLLRTVPTTVRVSSQVKNPAILPAHLVDRNLETAWNSATGELVGTWIDVDTALEAKITELRMTVGHTGHGKHGEDYFTMNPRIKRVTVYDQWDKVVGEATFDIANRGLQRIPIKPSRRAAIFVDEIVPGSKKTWRETCVSELEAWGTPPPKWTPPAVPLVPVVDVWVPPPPPPGPCDDILALQEERSKRSKATADYCQEQGSAAGPYCGMDEAGSPLCSTAKVPLDHPTVPWPAEAVVTCKSPDSHYAEGTCTIDLAVGEGTVTVTLVGRPQLDIDKVKASYANIIAGGDDEIVVRFHTDAGSYASDWLAVCQAKPAGCTDPIAVAGDDWSIKVRFENGTMITEKDTGDPAPDSLFHAPLVFK